MKSTDMCTCTQAFLFYQKEMGDARGKFDAVSVKFSSVIHLTVDDYYLRGFGFISISV